MTWRVLYNGVDVARFGVAEPWPQPDGRRVVLFVGRHEERKGLAVLLDAVGRRSPTTCVIWVAGEGPQTDELRARHPSDRIEWLGRVSDAERDARMSAADVFCAPSLGGESFGVILLEAMASGAPVVASGISGLHPGGRPARRRPPRPLLTPPGDAAALADALRAVLDDPQRADRAAGRRRGAGRAVLHAAPGRASTSSIYQRIARGRSLSGGGRDHVPGAAVRILARRPAVRNMAAMPKSRGVPCLSR